MPLYLLPARGDRSTGIEPEFPEGVTASAWSGVYDEDSHHYVIRSEEPIEGLTELADGEDVGFDYSGLTTPSKPPAVDESATPAVDESATPAETKSVPEAKSK